MKVYEIKELGDTTHVAFDGTVEQAKEWYIAECMCDEEEISSVKVLPKKKWKEVIVTFDEYDIEPFNTTVEEMMSGQTSPEILCSTAYL